MTAFESVSTWMQPVPDMASDARAQLPKCAAAEISELSPARLRLAIDGLMAAGKTSFGYELAAALRELGRPTLRASLDDFKRPWRHAREHGYERLTAEGYYRNAYDFEAAPDLVLGPAGPDGTGRVVLCACDPLTGRLLRDAPVCHARPASGAAGPRARRRYRYLVLAPPRRPEALGRGS